MLKEARKPEYHLNGYLLREANAPPRDWDIRNLWPEQREFILYLMALLPSLADLGMHLRGKIEENEINEKSPLDFVGERTEIQQAQDIVMAEFDGITVDEYLARYGRELQKLAVMKVRKKYGMPIDDLKDVGEERLRRVINIKPEYPDTDQ